MLAEVLPQLGQAVERDSVPETPGPRPPEEPIAHDPRDRDIRGTVISHLDRRCADVPEDLEASCRAPLGVREDARVRARVDEDAARSKDPVNLA